MSENYKADIYICTDVIDKKHFYQSLIFREIPLFKLAIEDSYCNEKIHHHYIVVEFYNFDETEPIMRKKYDFDFDKDGTLISNVSDFNEEYCDMKAKIHTVNNIKLVDFQNAIDNHPSNGKNWTEINSSYTWCLEYIDIMRDNHIIEGEIFTKDKNSPLFGLVLVFTGIVIGVLWKFSLFPFGK